MDSEEEKNGYGGKHLQKRKVLSLEWNLKWAMDNESGESMEPMEEVPVKELSESELERKPHTASRVHILNYYRWAGTFPTIANLRQRLAIRTPEALKRIPQLWQRTGGSIPVISTGRQRSFTEQQFHSRI